MSGDYYNYTLRSAASAVAGCWFRDYSAVDCMEWHRTLQSRRSSSRKHTHTYSWRSETAKGCRSLPVISANRLWMGKIRSPGGKVFANNKYNLSLAPFWVHTHSLSPFSLQPLPTDFAALPHETKERPLYWRNSFNNWTRTEFVDFRNIWIILATVSALWLDFFYRPSSHVY